MSATPTTYDDPMLTEALLVEPLDLTADLAGFTAAAVHGGRQLRRRRRAGGAVLALGPRSL